MSGDVHARFWESPGVRFPRDHSLPATRSQKSSVRKTVGSMRCDPRMLSIVWGAMSASRSRMCRYFDGAFFSIFRFVLEEIAVLLMMLSKVKLRSRRGRGCRTRRFSEQSRCGGSGRTEKSIKVSRRYDRGR